MRETKLCPHCGQVAVPILYGMPAPSAMEAADRRELILGGCDYSPSNPTWGCYSCGSFWATSDDTTTTAISTLFAEYFSNWSIELPAEAEGAAARGTIRKAGWLINYLFRHDDAGKYLEFYATHRMTNDRRHRIYESGRMDSLETIDSTYFWHPERGRTKQEAEREYREHNLLVAQELRRIGLYPEGDINAYLRTHDVPRADLTVKPDHERHHLHRTLAAAVGRMGEAFAENELAYLALTSKPEFVLRDQVAWDLHQHLWPDYQVAREWRPRAKGAWRTDLAILRAEDKEPLILLEAKAMYTFDAVKKARDQFPNLVKLDLEKTTRYATGSSVVYALVVAVHPRNPIPEEGTPAVKYSREVNTCLARYPSQRLRQEATAFLDHRLRRLGRITSAGSIRAGMALGVQAEILYWLVGPFSANQGRGAIDAQRVGRLSSVAVLSCCGQSSASSIGRFHHPSHRSRSMGPTFLRPDPPTA